MMRLDADTKLRLDGFQCLRGACQSPVVLAEMAGIATDNALLLSLSAVATQLKAVQI
jgi:hypothetical protein